MSRAPGPPSEPGTPDARVLAAFGFDRAQLTPFAGGLINRSWRVRGSDGRQAVLQAVNPIFPARIHEDIDAVTRHLAAKDVPTPQLIPTRDGALWLERGERVWRMMSYVKGITRDALEHPRQAREAGRLLGRFHHAVSDCDVRFANARLGVHDTAKHLAALRATLACARRHPAYAAVRPLAERYFQWDAARYGSASEHHRARTRGQLAVARDILRQRAALEEAVECTFA